MNKPRHPLATAQRPKPLISRKCAEAAALFMGEDDWKVGEKQVERLVKSLVPRDFSHTSRMGDPNKKPIFGDVYGKVDRYGLWYIKIGRSDGVTTVVMSCHEAEHDIPVAGGRTLRRKKER